MARFLPLVESEVTGRTPLEFSRSKPSTDVSASGVMALPASDSMLMLAAVRYPRGAFWRRLDPRSAGIIPLDLANSEYSSAVRALFEQVESSAPA